MFFVRVGSLTVHVFRSKPLASIRDTLIIGWRHIERHYAQKRLSPCAIPRIALWKPDGRCLIWSWNLKWIALRSNNTSTWASTTLYVNSHSEWWVCFTTCFIVQATCVRQRPLIWHRFKKIPILSWGEPSDQIGNAPLLFRNLSF
jgi:hypothetical protein